MLNMMMLGLVVAGPTDSQVYLNRYQLNEVIISEKLAEDYLGALERFGNGYDFPYQTKDPIAFVEYLKKAMDPVEWQLYEEDVRWRTACWRNLKSYLKSSDDVRTGKSIDYTGEDSYRRYCLSRLRELVGPERFAMGWMPAPLPTAPSNYVQWLNNLWTPEMNFQGRLNNLTQWVIKFLWGLDYPGPLDSYLD